VNFAPELLRPANGLTEVIPLDLSVYDSAVVIARETDGDDLTFSWEFPADVDEAVDTVATGTNQWTSTLAIFNRFDVNLHGREVVCLIFDEAIPANRLEIVFELQVPGGEEEL